MFTSSHESKHKDANTKERAKSAANHVDDGMRRIRKDARNTMGQVHSDLEGIVQNVGERVREFVETAEEGLIQAKDSIIDATDNVTAQVRRKPLPAMAIALGIGVLVGAFLRRR
jgi:ElaB/YqjD/DUF883 family membrane-anchored ribosome-binding protein